MTTLSKANVVQATRTAEVRVLQVNGLQITPFIAGQLDHVRLGKKATRSTKSGLVIGVDLDGSLALAQYDREVWNRSYYVDLFGRPPGHRLRRDGSPGQLAALGC